MSGDLGSLVISLIAETVQFKDALTKAATQMDASMGQMVQSVNSLQKPLAQVDGQLGAFGINLRNILGLAAAGGMAGLIADSIASAAHVQHLSEVTGIAADQLAAMKGAANATGTTLDQVAGASVKFSKAIETQNEDSGAAAKALGAMGLSMEDIKAKSPADALHTVAQRMNDFADGSGKAAAAQLLFGKAGAEILPFLKQYGEQVDLIKEGYGDYAKKAEEFERSLGKLKAGSTAITTHYAMELLPALKAVVDGFNAMNASAGDSGSVMGILGEAIRLLALGVASVWFAIKGVAADLVGSVKVAWAIHAGDVQGAIGAYRQWDAKQGDNEASYSAFVAKVTAGSAVFGTAADSVRGVGDASAAAKPNIDIAANAMQAAAQQAAAMRKESDDLQAAIDRLNGTDTTYEKTLGALARAANTGKISMEQYTIYAKLAYEQSKVGVQAHNDAATAAKAQAAALEKLVTTEQGFHDSLQAEIDKIGLTREEILKYDARVKGLGDSQDDLIHKNVTLLQQEADLKSAFSYAATEAKNYADYLNAISSRNQDLINDWITENGKLGDQINQLGMTKTAVEQLEAAKKYEKDQALIYAQAEGEARDNQLTALKNEYEARVNLINEGAERAAMLAQIDKENADMKAAMASIEEEATKTAKSINDSLTNALYDGLVKNGKSFGETLKNALESMFKNLVLKPILQPVSNYLSGLYQDATGSLGGIFGAGGLFAAGSASAMGPGTNTIAGGAASAWGNSAAYGSTWGSMLAGIGAGGVIGGALGAASPSHSSTIGAIGGIGAAIGLAGATGTIAVAAGAAAASAGLAAAASVAAVVPVIGWIVAAIALIASFVVKPGGGPKTGGSAFATFDASGSGTYDRGGANAFYTPNDKDSDLQKFVGQIGANYGAWIKALGGTASAVQFGMGYDMDPAGTAPNRLGTSVTVAGKQVYGFRDLDLGRDASVLQARMTAESQRMMLAAIQASNLPQDIAKIINAYSPATLSGSEVSNLLSYAAAFQSLPQRIKDGLAGIDAIHIDPATSANLAKFGAAYSAVAAIINADMSKDVAGVMSAANETAIEKFRAQGVALTDLAQHFDGSADAALNLAQATATYYNNMVQLYAALAQASQQFHAQIQDTQRGFLMDILGAGEKQAYFRKDYAAQQAIIGAAEANAATADPAQVQAAAARARQDLVDWWSNLSAEEKTQQYSTFTQTLTTLDDSVTRTNMAIAQAIANANDPKNPDSPIGQVKGAFDKFMLDMGKWLEDNRAAFASQTTAAQDMQDAASTMQAAANTQLAAANTPITVEVSGGGGEAGQ